MANGDIGAAPAGTGDGSPASRGQQWVLGLSVGSLVAVVLAAIQVGRDVATREDLSAMRLEHEKQNDRIWSEFARRESLAFRQDDWLRERSRIDTEHESMNGRTERLETAMGHLRAKFPHNLPGNDESRWRND